MYFDNIILIGSGKIACDCVEILHKNDIALYVLESRNSSISMLRRTCEKNGIDYEYREELSEITKAITDRIQGTRHTLIISANNEYLFPKELIARPEVTIINFHYSYLPDYRGMNIPTWVIYNNEKFTGITWHYVNSGVDAGEIILQKKIELLGAETALDVVKQVMEKGKEAFEEFILSFLETPLEGKKNSMEGGHIYRRKQLPADGILDVSADVQHILRLLRAYDYGSMQVIPRLKVFVGDDVHEVKRYRVKKDDRLILGKDNWKEDFSIKKEAYVIDLKF